MEVNKIYNRRLPHYHGECLTYFITFRLYGSLPNDLVAKIEERKTYLKVFYKDSPEQLRRALKVNFNRYEKYLDFPQNGPYHLTNSAVANIVKEAIHYQEGTNYDLHAYCIMSNHVHLLITTLPGAPILYNILGRMKRYSARQANKVLNLTGQTFWQEESYDHIVRKNGEFMRIWNYVLQNPVKARLVKDWREWPNSYSAIRY